uniref:SWIM-type domain-containing protein n=1 Tax=Tanacetum cinerariifolium TaxID=118510 RepID=A0A699GV05_TANCI|nr:hypothetical protein [Tanacetum cinerariifolium]
MLVLNPKLHDVSCFAVNQMVDNKKLGLLRNKEDATPIITIRRMSEDYNFPHGNCIHCVGVGTNVEEEFDLADLLNVVAKTLRKGKGAVGFRGSEGSAVEELKLALSFKGNVEVLKKGLIPDSGALGLRYWPIFVVEDKPKEDQVNFICDENQINGDNIIGRKLFVCNKQGFKKQKGDNSSEVSKKCRRDVRTGCEAELWISKTKGRKWCLDIFNDTHNYDLNTTPTKVMKHRSHNKFHRSMACKSLMVELGKSVLRPCQVRKATMLNEFVIQFDKAVDTRRAAEKDEDFKTMNSRPVLSSIHPIEAKADVTCSCAMFETYGILCKYILYVMEKKHVDTLPDHYIIARWTLDCRYKGGNASIGIEETNSENEVSALALWYVQSNLTKEIEQARDAPFKIKRLNIFLLEFLEDQMIRKKPTKIENAYKYACVGISQVDKMPQFSVRDPVVLTILKGRPRNETRVKPPIDVKQKNNITCFYCRKIGQNITGCREKKAASMQETK